MADLKRPGDQVVVEIISNDGLVCLARATAKRDSKEEVALVEVDYSDKSPVAKMVAGIKGYGAAMFAFKLGRLRARLETDARAEAERQALGKLGKG
jgi:hypothetical protein